MPLKIQEIKNDAVKIGTIKMNRNRPIAGNENMPIDKYNFSILISGPSGSGKSNVWVSMLSKGGMLAKKFHDIHIWSPSIHTIKKSIGIPEENIHETLDLEELTEMLDYFNRLKKAGVEKQVLFIFDDMIGDLMEKYGSEIVKMILNRAHMGLSVIFTSQSYNKIPLILRKNMSGVIQFNTINKRELNSIREELTSYDKNEWNDIVKKTLISPHDFLFIRNDSKIYRNFNLLSIEE